MLRKRYIYNTLFIFKIFIVYKSQGVNSKGGLRFVRECFGRLASARRILLFGEYLLQTFPVYNELMTIYIPQEKPKYKFAV